MRRGLWRERHWPQGRRVRKRKPGCIKLFGSSEAVAHSGLQKELLSTAPVPIEVKGGSLAECTPPVIPVAGLRKGPTETKGLGTMEGQVLSEWRC